MFNFAFLSSPWKSAAILLLISIFAFAPGISSLPVLDRDEARFAQASKQMMQTQDFIDILFQEEARHKKPIGIYWAQVLTSKAFDEGAHDEIWAYRVPSFLGAIMAVLFTFWAAKAVMPTRGAFIAGLILASSVLLMAEARIAKTDASLLFTICMAQAFFIHIVQMLRAGVKAPSWYFIGFWAAIGGGILLKGPIIPLVMASTIFGLSYHTKDWKLFSKLKPLWGFTIVMLICAPWFIAIMVKSNGSFLQESVGKDLLQKVGSAQEKHGAPPLTYFVLFPIIFWPWAGIFYANVKNIWTERKGSLIQWAFWWAVPLWLMFELIPTKLPHYVLPALPACAIILAWALTSISHQNWKMWQKSLLWIPPIISLVFIGVVAVGTHIIEGQIHWISVALMFVCAIFSFFACLMFLQHKKQFGIIASCASGILLSFTLIAVTLPNMPSLFLSSKIDEAVHITHPCSHPTVGLVGYYEPSAVFLLGTQTKQLKPNESAEFLQKQYSAQYCHVVVLDTLPHPKKPNELSAEAQFLADAEQLKITPQKLTTVQGRNMNGGRERFLSIWSLNSQR